MRRRESPTDSDLGPKAVNGREMRVSSSRAMMKWWLMPLFVCALLGIAITAAYYCVPMLKSSRIVSFMVPFKVFVEPIFGHRPNAARLTVEAVAPLNAVLYGALGVIASLIIKALRKS